MAEETFFWDDIVTGDATLAPYSAASYREVWRRLLTSEDQTGIVRGGLAVRAFLDYGTYFQAQVGPGAAIVKGVMYVSDSPVMFHLNKPASGTYYYAIVLRYFANQVRLALLGPSTNGYPSLTQTSAQYELLVNYIAVPAGSAPQVNMFVDRLPINDRGNIVQLYRVGGNSTDFTVAGTTVYTNPYGNGIQIGVKRWTGTVANAGNVAITFPVAFSANPLVFAMAQRAHSDFGQKIHCRPTVENISTTGATIYWMVPSPEITQIDFDWIAVGSMNNI